MVFYMALRTRMVVGATDKETDNWEAARVLHAKREAARMVVGATYKETCESRIEPTTSTQTRQ